ncbi:MAG: hypothetical protein IJL66_03155 [Lachnospiraceae bacterium]|nr:hypothetical protein [Lachnospiraceae bacterium]
MKEQYVRPVVYVESFTLTQTIAKDCGDMHQGTLGESNHYDEYSCVWNVGGVILFYSDHCEDYDSMGLEEGEEFGPDDDFEIGGRCFNNPTGGQQIFSST